MALGTRIVGGSSTGRTVVNRAFGWKSPADAQRRKNLDKIKKKLTRNYQLSVERRTRAHKAAEFAEKHRGIDTYRPSSRRSLFGRRS